SSRRSYATSCSASREGTMRSRWFGLVVAALAAALSVWAYPRLPETIATQWSLRGMPDGYSSRTWAATFIPLLIVVLTGVFAALCKVDPEGANYENLLDVCWLIVNSVRVFVRLADALLFAAG